MQANPAPSRTPTPNDGQMPVVISAPVTRLARMETNVDETSAPTTPVLVQRSLRGGFRAIVGLERERLTTSRGSEGTQDAVSPEVWS